MIFERDEVLTQAGRPFGVFTPYKNAWLEALTPSAPAARIRSTRYAGALAPPAAGIAGAMPALEAMGFRRTNLRRSASAPG